MGERESTGKVWRGGRCGVGKGWGGVTRLWRRGR